MTRWRCTTIRTRLTLLYAAAFFLAGAFLVALTFVLTAHQLRTGAAHQIPRELVGQPSDRFGQDHAEVMRTMLVSALVSLGVVGAAAGGFGWVLAGRGLRPLQDITATARRVADRNLHERIALDGPDDEIKRLADTFDAMLERLDRAFDTQRRFVANASHELRTPLTINRTLLEVALDNPQAGASLRQLAADLITVNRRHEHLIDSLLTLAGSDEPLRVHHQVDLADIAQHLAAKARPTAQELGVKIRCTPGPAFVAGDPILLERLIQNLIDNAIHYNLPEHGQVVIITTTVDGAATLTVDNTGAPVPTHEIPGLFEPFHRLTTTERRANPNGQRGGAGLGLSIVRSVARAHHGNVQATARPDGGLTMQLRIPAYIGGTRCLRSR